MKFSARLPLALLTIFLAAVLLRLGAVPPEKAREQVGPLPDGGFLLNTGWTIRPTGDEVPVDTFPMSTALSNNGKYLLVLNGGYNPPSISVIDIASKHEIGRTPVPDAWLGLFTEVKGNRVWVGGGSTAMVYEFTLNPETGALTRARTFATNGKFTGDVTATPDSHLLYAADLYDDSVTVVNLQSGIVIDHWKVGRRPYRLLLSPGERQLLVSSWADASVYQYDANSGQSINRTRVGPHPTDMVWINRAPAAPEGSQTSFIARLLVAAANTNNVYSFGITADGQLNPIESINVSMTPLHPLGMTPSAIAVNAAGTSLYVVCSDTNAVAVADISGAHSEVKGLIPTGWYPTAVRLLPDNQIAILNGKGLGSHPNPNGPNPSKRAAPLYEGGPASAEGGAAPTAIEYVGHIQTGTVAFLPIPSDEQLAQMTITVFQNSPYRDEMLNGPIDDEQTARFTKLQNHASPIQHVIYIIKENRTYDQVLGDIPTGNGDKNLNLFGEEITPNLHQLAREYVLYDNFYENSDVSADGHNWATAAIAPDYTVKMWPNEYGHRSKLYNFEGGEPANTPPAGYIWNNAMQAGISVRNYGDWAENIPLKSVTGTRQVKDLRDASLIPVTDLNYRAFDLEYSDIDRAHEFIREWKDFEAKNQAPQLLVVRMGNDHTQGMKAGVLTPFAYAAQNDYAVGLLVDAVSKSRLWQSTAIFIIEDDAQNGPDHVDSHRAPAWAISPYTHRGITDSNMYNQTGILRTMELILGLRPMTHFDAAARPLFGSFAKEPDVKPYNAIEPKTSLTARNPGNTPEAAASARMNFSDADEVDDNELTAVLWRGIKHTDPPPPTHSAFAK